jgi:hypothetical protein
MGSPRFDGLPELKRRDFGFLDKARLKAVASRKWVVFEGVVVPLRLEDRLMVFRASVPNS